MLIYTLKHSFYLESVSSVPQNLMKRLENVAKSKKLEMWGNRWKVPGNLYNRRRLSHADIQYTYMYKEARRFLHAYIIWKHIRRESMILNASFGSSACIHFYEHIKKSTYIHFD